MREFELNDFDVISNDESNTDNSSGKRPTCYKCKYCNVNYCHRTSVMFQETTESLLVHSFANESHNDKDRSNDLTAPI